MAVRVDAVTARASYNTDLSRGQRRIIAKFLPKPSKVGRPRKHDLLEIMDAIFYVLRTGCAWSLLPHDFPPWKSVYRWFQQFQMNGILRRINDALVRRLRRKYGRQDTPSMVIIDSQSVKSSFLAGIRGFDGGKFIKGIKRHILVDTEGLLLAVVVHSAGVSERAGARMLLERLGKQWTKRLERILADAGYDGQPMIDWVWEQFQWFFDAVGRNEKQKGFHVLKWRWVVERTFSWFGRYRRLSKNYEVLTDTSEAMLYLAMIHLMLRRLA